MFTLDARAPGAKLSSVRLASLLRIQASHPLRWIRELADQAVGQLDYFFFEV